MIIYFAEVQCDNCEMSSNYVIEEDQEEFLDKIADDGWVVEYNRDGEISIVFCCLKCREEYSEKEDVVDFDLDDDYKEDLNDSGMHIEHF